MGLNLSWLGEDQRLALERGYLAQGETPEERFQTICDTVQKWADKRIELAPASADLSRLEGIGKRFERYVSNNWTSFSTPVLKSFGSPDNLPISCNHSIIEDSLDDIYKGLHETGMLAKHGAGTAVNFSDIRPGGSQITTGGISNTIMDWVELYADMMSKTAQNSQRRGFLTAYLSLDHPEIMDFLDIGTKAIPKEKRRFFETITTAVVIPEGWRQALKDGDAEKRKIFTKVLNTRKEAGFPYILDEENCNKGLCQAYYDKGLRVRSSNICIEAMEYTDYEKTFACCLSAVNLYWYDDWKKDPDFLFDMFLFLDFVLDEYIEKGSKIPGLQKAVKFAKEHRAIGLGVTAFHSLLQKKNIAMGDMDSYFLNSEIFRTMRQTGEEATKWMAENFGEPEILKGYGRRNTSLMAVAPKKSTTFIDGGTTRNFSEGIEPHKMNYGERKVAKIQATIKNKELEEVLRAYGQDTPEVWESILVRNGSVQHLDFLSKHEKRVFRTFGETSQMDLIKLAAQRQQYIDMGQSLNVLIHPDTPARDEVKLHLAAFEEGLKSLYYRNSINAAQKFAQELLECSSCEG